MPPKTPTKRKPAKIVNFDDVRRSSRKEFNIQRGEVREGALNLMSEEEIEALVEEERKTRNDAAKDRLEKKAARKKARAKAKASKAFDKTYGPSSGTASGETSGPRPAVYKAKMGATHKKTNKLQSKGAGKILANASLPKFDFSKFSKLSNVKNLPVKAMRAIGAFAVVAIFVVALYGPAQQYYQQMRETDRLQAEYAAVAARNDTLQSTIDTLSTEEGVEDKARVDLGYVKKNEQTATVKGITLVEEDKEFTSNVIPGSIPAPETWYSPILDVLFNYPNS